MKTLAHAASQKSPFGQVSEDSFVADAELGLYVVCDGMGAHAAGEVASSLACKIIHRYVADRLEDPDEVSRGLLERALREACRAVYEYGCKHPEARGLGTTATAVLLRDGVCYLAHVGDSRAYLIRGGAINQLTRDHTLVAEFVEQGIFPAEQADLSPYAHVLTRALGSQPSVIVDSLKFDVVPRDRILLCSDGAFPAIGSLRSVVAQGEEGLLSVSLAQFVVDEAVRSKGEDDSTVVEIYVESCLDDYTRDTHVNLTFCTLHEMMLFGGLEFSELAQLVEYSTIRTVNAGEYVIRQGARGREMFVILEGSLRVERKGLALAYLQPGDHFGEMSVISGQPRSADVIAIDDSTLLEIPEEGFLAVSEREPVIGFKLYKALASRLCELLSDQKQGPPDK